MAEAIAGPQFGQNDYKSREKGDSSLDILAVVASRVAMFGVLFWTVLTFDKESLARGLVLIYGLSTVLYLATWITTYRSKNTSPVGFLLFFQFFIELLVEAAIFYSNDGYLSDYGLLFILTILSAGYFFRYIGSMVVAGTATLLFGYAGMVHLGMTGIVDLALPRLFIETVQVRFFLYTTLFFMVALLSSLLAGRLQTVRRELAGAHQAMDLYQFSAETVMNGLPTGLLFFDSEMLLKFSNGLSEEWLGRHLIPGMPMRGILEGMISSSILEDIEMRRENFPLTELKMQTVNGQHLHLQIKPLIRLNQYLGCVWMLIDFTQEDRMAEALLRSERMASVGTMSARIAHEIRNPLASITGSAQLLKETVFENGSDRKLLGLIVTESERLDRILSGLLDFTRESKPAYREVSIREIFKKITLIIESRPEIKKDLVILNTFIENTDIRFSCDQDILVQVLLNIALNALQALPLDDEIPGKIKGKIDFKAREEEEKIIIQISDNGTGMNPAEMSKAFEPFFTKKPTGSGLGLSTCQHYVQALEGNITLGAAELGGTEVTVTLPMQYNGMGLG